jgi:hypothetical protein
MGKQKFLFLYSILAIIPLGIPIGMLIYGIQNSKELKEKFNNFKLRISWAK